LKWLCRILGATGVRHPRPVQKDPRIPAPDSIRFTPSRVTGLADVTEVAVFPDRLELTTPAGVVAVPFRPIARRQQPLVAARLQRLLRLAPPPPLVGEREWVCEPTHAQFFRFFTTPPLTIHMPAGPAASYAGSPFRRIQDVLRHGGYATFDLT
jgi:hypothetical protein